MYNLVVNNESYGDLRLTPIFEDYIKEPNTLGNDYLHFSTKVDSGEIDLFDYMSDLKEIADKTVKSQDDLNKIKQSKDAMENDILFYTLNIMGKLNVLDPITGASKELSIINSDFVVNTTLDPISKDKQRMINISNILKYIRSNALIVTIECK